jgi:hypothetical protein
VERKKRGKDGVNGEESARQIQVEKRKDVTTPTIIPFVCFLLRVAKYHVAKLKKLVTCNYSHVKPHPHKQATPTNLVPVSGVPIPPAVAACEHLPHDQHYTCQGVARGMAVSWGETTQ